MIQINLLPKEYRKKSKLLSLKKGTVYVLAAAGAMVVLMLFATAYQGWKIKSINTKIAEARDRTERLKKDIQLVDALSDVRQKLLQRMAAMENLDKYRTVWIRIMEDLSIRIPSYLWLSGFKEEAQVAPTAPAANNASIPTTNPIPAAVTAPDTARKAEQYNGPRRATLDGYCYSINSLAAFLINLSRSNYFKNVDLKFIRSSEQDKHKFFSFQLGCDLIYYIEPPSFAKAEQGTAGPSPAGPQSIDQTPAEEVPSDEAPAEQAPSDEKQPGQTKLDRSQSDQTLAHQDSAPVTESQKTNP